jgi:hypothetical protein
MAEDPEEEAEVKADRDKVLAQGAPATPNERWIRKQYGAKRELGSWGCVLPAALAVVVMGALIAFAAVNRDDGKCKSAPRRGGLMLIDCTKSDSVTSESVNSESAKSESVNSEGGTAGDGTASVPPPDASSLPKGAILLQGQSGDNIGFIAGDGLNRFLSLNGPGVSVGDPNKVAVAWDKGAGKVVSFGANLHTGTNKGRYGFAVFRNPTYLAGCAIEVGQTSCKSDTAGQVMANGDSITIIIGEAGTGTGDFSCDWWFVFQPD